MWIRFAFLSFLICSTSAEAVDRAVSGLWFNPAQSGHGFELTAVADDTVAVTWYTYTPAGFATWVISLLSETSPGVLEGTAQYYQGMRFGSFLPSQNIAFEWGTLKLTFHTCDTATVQYNGTLRFQDGMTFGSGAIPIQKLAGVNGLRCGASQQVQQLPGIYKGSFTSSVGAFDVFAVAEPDGTFTAVAPGNAAYFGTYTSGPTENVSVAFAALSAPGATFRNGLTTGNVTGSGPSRQGDFIRGIYSGAGDSGAYGFSWSGATSRAPSLASLAGSYSDGAGFSGSLSSTGTLSASDSISGCRYNGSLSPGSAPYVFSLSVAVSNCVAAGSYTGKAFQWDVIPGDGKALVVALRLPQNAFAALLRRP